MVQKFALNNNKQAGAELGQAQVKLLTLNFYSIFVISQKINPKDKNVLSYEKMTLSYS